jgi:hypothetical protein
MKLSSRARASERVQPLCPCGLVRFRTPERFEIPVDPLVASRGGGLAGDSPELAGNRFSVPFEIVGQRRPVWIAHRQAQSITVDV